MKKRKKKAQPQPAPASPYKEQATAVDRESPRETARAPQAPAPDSAAWELAPALPDSDEPTVSKLPVPIVVIVLLGVLLYFSDMYLMEHSGGFDQLVYYPNREVPDPPGGPSLKKLGEQVYSRIGCVGCHQPDGAGSTAQNVPPLAGSEWVLAEGPNRLARIVMHGLNGPIEVSGKSYSNQMLAFGGLLTDEEIAAVLTFIRQNEKWGNNASEVSVEQVKAIRDAEGSRTAQWTAAELQQIPAGP